MLAALLEQKSSHGLHLEVSDRKHAELDFQARLGPVFLQQAKAGDRQWVRD
jgi:hypothetical protein